MFTLQINKRPLWYCLQGAEETVYKTDGAGNVIYQEIEGVGSVPIPKGKVRHYYNPVKFSASLSMQGGEAEAVEYGVDITQYSAKIVVEKNYVPLTETSLLWLTEPEVDGQGRVDKETADYKVVKVSSSLNFDTFLLQKVAKNG